MRRKSLPKTIILLTLALFTFTDMTLAYNLSQPNPPTTRNKIVRYGKAAWYSAKDPGINRYTANNEIFNDKAMTCAMPDTPFNQQVRITNVTNGKSIIVRVNDRGPHKRFVRQGRIVDLTKNAFVQIASLKKGVIEVRLELL